MPFEINKSLSIERTKPHLICFSHLRWEFVYQRPQHLLSRAAKTHDVIFFEEPVYVEIAEPALELRPSEGGVRIAVPHLPVGCTDAVTMQRNLLDKLIVQLGGMPDIVWYYTPMALAFSRHLNPQVVVYDNMDELSAFRGAPPELIALEEQLLERADVVFTGGRSLYEAKKGRHANLHPFPSSIDAAHFQRARLTQSKTLPDQDHLARPRLGFFGVIDERMDTELVSQIATGRPDWQFVMIGPVVKIDPSSLPRRDNIHWIGAKDYRDLPDYLAGWDLGIMPFALNESTRFISPTKTPEFLAAGLPVVSTAIEDVIRPYGDLGLVEIARGPDDFVAKAELLLARPREDWLGNVDEYLAGTSWDDTWRAMLSIIDQARAPVARQKAELKEAIHV